MLKNRKGFIVKDGFHYSVVIDNNGTLLPIDNMNFKHSITRVKGGLLAMMVSNYLMHGFLPSDIPQEVEDEIKLAIGDKG